MLYSHIHISAYIHMYMLMQHHNDTTITDAVTFSTCSVIYKFSITCINSLVTVPRASITIGINVTFMFHSLFVFVFQFPSKYLSFFSLSFNFTLWSAGTAKSTIRQVLSFFVWIIIRPSRLAEIR